MGSGFISNERGERECGRVREPQSNVTASRARRWQNPEGEGPTCTERLLELQVLGFLASQQSSLLPYVDRKQSSRPEGHFIPRQKKAHINQRLLLGVIITC